VVAVSDESPRLTTTEARPVLRHRGACTCTWRGPWRLDPEQARADRDTHSRTHGG
jgi:hypothetical protein